jgi:hypothetical protein
VKDSGFCRCFPAIELYLLHIIFVSDYSESSHSRSRLHRGSLPKRGQPGYPFEFRVVLQGGKVRRGDSVRLE